jgi:Zn-finger nucleic acid-binding protein
VSPYRSHPARACPRCRVPLERRRAGTLRAEACAACRGMWLPRGSLDEFLVASEADLDLVGSADRGELRREPTFLAHPLTCPRCARPMKREQMSSAGLIVDLCAAHGMWFDSGELRALLAWLRAGGA